MENRTTVLLVSSGAGLVFILLLSLLLDSGFFADFLLDRNTNWAPYPFTIQNVMWLVFFFGLGELYLRHESGSEDLRQISLGLLPEDETSLLRPKDLPALYRKVRQSDPDRRHFLQRMLTRCILQFQSSNSVDQANTLFNSSLELYQHEVELRYNMLRYIVWLIPTLGFIGTVVGIALALSDAGAAKDFQDPELLKVLTRSLGVAFYTTLLALMMSAVLVFLMHVVEGREERVLNTVGQYTLDNLINRLYEK